MTYDDPCVYPSCGCRNDGPNDAFRCRAMNPSSARAVVKTPHWRIDDPDSGLAVKFTCQPAPPGETPKVNATLVKPARASIFMSHAHAAECFSRYMRGAVADIVKVVG